MPNAHLETPRARDEFALLIDAVQDYAIFLLSPAGEIRSWNRGAARIMGYTAHEILGLHFSKFYEPDDLRDAKPQRELAIASSEGVVRDEGWRIRKDGGRFWANTVITAIRDPGGNLVGFAKVTRDMTEQREAQERLRQSEELFRLLVESVRDYAIFMLDADGCVATWNLGAQRIKGYDADDIIGRHFSTFYPAEDRNARKPERELEIARERGSVEDEGWRLRKDGSRFWANVVITAVHDSAGRLRGFAKVTRDITERKQADEMRRSLLEQREARLQAEEERRRAEASVAVAHEANRAKDEFLMTLSHELRTPMTAILGWARLLPTIAADDPMFAEAIAAIRRSAQLQARLIDDVLDVSRVMSGKLRLTRENVDVEKLLRSAVDAVRPMADGRSITLRTSVTSGLGTIFVDPTRLHQVVWNLLTNAVKFTPAGGWVELRAHRSATQVEISVQDSGEGIDPEFLSHIFEPFRQAESPRTRVHGGLGLGLSIVSHLVEAHGGAVRAESAGRGKGSTFTATLPATTAPRQTPPPETDTNDLSDAPIDPHILEKARVLIVDDDRETRDFLRVALRKAGAEVDCVESASAALDAIDAAPPTAILTDIAMPAMDGYEFARAVRRMRKADQTKIVALTAFPAGIATAERNGFDEYLSKPIDPIDLIEAIAKTIGRE